MILITEMKIKGFFFLVHIKCVNFSTIVLHFWKRWDKVLAFPQCLCSIELNVLGNLVGAAYHSLLALPCSSLLHASLSAASLQLEGQVNGFSSTLWYRAGPHIEMVSYALQSMGSGPWNFHSAYHLGVVRGRVSLAFFPKLNRLTETPKPTQLDTSCCVISGGELDFFSIFE